MVLRLFGSGRLCRLAILLMVGVLALGCAWFVWLRRPPAMASQPGQDVSHFTQAQFQPDAELSPVDSVSAQQIVENTKGLSLPVTTGEDLLRKGFPLMSAPRGDALRATRNQTTQQLVDDLGNMTSISLCSINDNVAAGPSHIAYYTHQVSHHVKVLRLIEEGRRAPGEVTRLLKSAVTDIIEGFPRMRETYARAYREFVSHLKDEPPYVGEDDEYYARNHRYEHPLFEFPREVTVVYSSFYIMANLGTLDPELLARWIKMKRRPHGQCLDMDAWLVDAYFRNASADVHRDAHMAFVASHDLRGETVRRSAWDALWDIDEPLLRITGVDLSGIRTIEILDVPPALPKTITPAIRGAILWNFLTHVDEMRRRLPVDADVVIADTVFRSN